MVAAKAAPPPAEPPAAVAAPPFGLAAFLPLTADARSLVLLRVSLAVTVAGDLLARARGVEFEVCGPWLPPAPPCSAMRLNGVLYNLQMFYTDAGVLPRSAQLASHTQDGELSLYFAGAVTRRESLLKLGRALGRAPTAENVAADPLVTVCPGGSYLFAVAMFCCTAVACAVRASSS